MLTKTLVRTAIAAGSLLCATVASAAVVATFNPQAQNGLGALGVIDAATPAFNAVGFSSDLSSSLMINANTGTTTYMETGSINITDFKTLANTNALSNVNSNYKIFGNFTLSGSGSWAGGVFTASAPGTVFSMNLQALSATSQTINLGIATLDTNFPVVAFSIAFGSVAPGSFGSALTSLSAGLKFTPTLGTTGAGGFFQAPSPFDLVLAVGNAGGNLLNTGYSVDGSGKVTFVTPLPGTNAGTANVTFANRVPEPGSLALVGLAMLGVAAVRRKAAAKV